MMMCGVGFISGVYLTSLLMQVLALTGKACLMTMTGGK